MAQLFSPGFNTLCTASLFVGAVAPFAILYTGSVITNSPYNTKVDVPLEQPVPFSHKHHANELGIDCRFCHPSVEESANAGVPTTDVCMTCHSQIWTNSPNLQAVRESWETGTPIQWAKVNDVPDFVYFNHSIHIDRGVSCNNCHGKVNEMHLTWKGNAFRMAWCLECHENPQKFLYADTSGKGLSPREQVFDLYRKIASGAKLNEVEQRLAEGLPQFAPDDKVHQGLKVIKERGINVSQLKDCYVCHH
jgi:hypothetical protein